jgi:beta-glucosidase
LRTALRPLGLPWAALAGCLALAMPWSSAPAGRDELPASRLEAVGRAAMWRKGAAPGRVSQARCPWTTPAGEQGASAQALATEVLGHMDLAEKLDLVVIRYDGAYENEIPGVPALCIPPVILQDGAAGVAYHMKDVTQLPAPIGVGASFDASLADAYGQVVGEEDKGKGIEVFQGPSVDLVRVPEAGRAFESYGEDPELVSALGVAEIDGVQSTGVVAEATHLPAYTQETDRTSLGQIVSERALQEVYLAPFRAAVEDGHVGSAMCAYGKVNGVRACQDDAVFDELDGWGFDGLLRSDLDAVTSSVLAFSSGIDAIKPASPSTLAQLVRSGKLPERRLDDAVVHVLETLFRFGLIEHPFRQDPAARVDTASHTDLARRAAEESMVLLRDRGGLLPLSPRTPSLAVIGSDAGDGAMTAGQGSAHVLAPFLSTPVSAIASGSRLRIAAGHSPTAALPAIPSADVRRRALGLRASKLLAAAEVYTAPLVAARRLLEGISRGGAAGTGSIPPQDFADLDDLKLTVVPPRTGLYAVSLSDDGDAWLNLDGKLLFADSGEHVRATWQVAAELRAHETYRLSLYWFPVMGEKDPVIGWQDETPSIGQAVAAARASSEAIVFADAPSSEGVDRPDLLLPGVQDALISDVAAANPKTVVVLNTPGAVLMPWLHAVGAVLEAWYPARRTAPRPLPCSSARWTRPGACR